MRTLGTVCFVLAILCVSGFLIGSLITRPASPERLLNKIEKFSSTGDTGKFAKMYAKDQGITPENAVLPFEGRNAELLFEDIQDLGDKRCCIHYTAYFEITSERQKGSKTKTVQEAYCYAGNELYVRKGLFGYKLLNE